MTRSRAGLLPVIACLAAACPASASSAAVRQSPRVLRPGALAFRLAAVSRPHARISTPASGAFVPRIGPAMGLMPPAGSKLRMPADLATQSPTPLTYHAGSVMAGGITVHTIFWAPSGYSFLPAPPGAAGSYEGLMKQFFSDAAHDSGAGGTCTPSECNMFTVLPQYAEGTSLGQITPGAYSISYSSSANSVDDTDPYPAPSSQCASPAGVATCVTDGQVQAEIDSVIQSTSGTPRGLNNLWVVFLPPGVDECVIPKVCGTNAFGGYHEVADPNGHGVTIYAVVVDPSIEAPIPPGADPEGFPDAEVSIVTAAHEAAEAMTDPEGAGWMDPNGSEVGDKCETQVVGTPLGFAANGAPFNQVINGHQYLIQQMWANIGTGGNSGCVQATTATTNQLPLPQVNLVQFSPTITGNVQRAPGGGIGVRVTLLRESVDGKRVPVMRASTTTAADGSWAVSLAPHAVGDDRDEIDVDYSGANAPTPNHQMILTGNGGNPFTLAGWIGWFDMDNGSAASNGSSGSSVSFAPCFQTGASQVTVNGSPLSVSPNDLCSAQTNAAVIPISHIGPGDRITWTSTDNRAFAPTGVEAPNPLGALVSLTVPVGEAGSVFCVPGMTPCAPPFTEPPQTFFTPGGFPSCAVDLELQAAGCTGLVPGATYTLIDGRHRASGKADSSGTVIALLAVSRGSTVSVSNGVRTLTTLHVARLRVDLVGDVPVVGAGSCQPGDYWGTTLASPPINSSAGALTTGTDGVALTGSICPLNGNASGLPTTFALQGQPTTFIGQLDELSGGETQTEVPDLVDTSPLNGEVLYGKFTALAETGIVGSDSTVLPTDAITQVGFAIVPARGGRPVFTARDVDRPTGVTVSGLKPGSYVAVWRVLDVNGDTRTATTRFVEELSSGPKATATCRFVGRSRSRIRCKLKFPQLPPVSGSVRVRLSRGGHVVALGHATVRKGAATVTMRVINNVTSGRWKLTLVLSQRHRRPQTINLSLNRVA